MLEIILTILKFAGIGIGILLLILLILLLLVLFVPVRYDVKGENKENLQARGKVYWLFHIVSFVLLDLLLVSLVLLLLNQVQLLVIQNLI